MNSFQNQGWKSAREERLRDFEARKSDETKNHFKTGSFDSEFVTVHPMADESWWFDKFHQSPGICKGVDLYWKFDGDVAFVEIWSRDVSGIELYARWKRGGRLYLSAGVKGCFNFLKNRRIGVERILARAFRRKPLPEILSEEKIPANKLENFKISFETKG